MKVSILLSTIFLLSLSLAITHEECDNGLGYSVPGRSELSCQSQDCCCCEQTAHIHDLREMTDNNTRISIKYKIGSKTGIDCEDRVTIYVSNNTQEWEREGTTTTCESNEQCKDTEYVYRKYRYVKLETSKCYLDYSEIDITETEPADTTTLGLILLMFMLLPVIMFMVPIAIITIVIILVLRRISKSNRTTTQTKDFKKYEFEKRHGTINKKDSKKPGFFG